MQKYSLITFENVKGGTSTKFERTVTDGQTGRKQHISPRRNRLRYLTFAHSRFDYSIKWFLTFELGNISLSQANRYPFHVRAAESTYHLSMVFL
jgi:hypothetical protein